MKGYTRTTAVIGAILASLLVALLALTVIEEVEYQRQENFSNLPDYTYVFYIVAPLSLLAIVGGFWLMRRDPMLCASLITSGGIALSIMPYWLIVPIFVATGLSFFAFRRARRFLLTAEQ